MPASYPHLFSPIKIGNVTVKNRVMLSPMITNYGIGTNGLVTARRLEYYGAIARGGVGIVETESAAVHLGGRAFFSGLGVWDDCHVEGLSELARTIHEGGAKAFLQLFHGGRQTMFKMAGTQPTAPSPIPCPRLREMPRELTREEIAEIVEAFAQAASRALRAGFDAVDVHSGHGYLVNQFFSPYSNKRTDEYGGDLQGRTRFAREVIHRIREVTEDRITIIARISGDEYMEGGIKLEESQRIARVLVEAGVSAISVSAGVYGCTPPTSRPHGTPFAGFSHLSQGIKEAVNVPVFATGRITTPAIAEEVIRSGQADLVAVGKALIADPDWARKAQEGRPEDIIVCPSCNACSIQPIIPDVACLVNPFIGKNEELQVHSVARPKRVAVVGGGLTGLLAARISAQRGHRVTLLHDGKQPGGLLSLRGQIRHLEEWTGTMEYQVRDALRAGVTMKPGSELTPEAVIAENPDVVIVALPGPMLRPSPLPFPEGLVVPFDRVLKGDAVLGQDVVVWGGGVIGAEVAYHLATLGKRVTIIEKGDMLACDTPAANAYFLAEWRKEVDIRVLNNATILDGTGKALRVARNGETVTLDKVDNVVLAFGFASIDETKDMWQNVAREVYLVDEPYEAFVGRGHSYQAARIAADI